MQPVNLDSENDVLKFFTLLPRTQQNIYVRKGMFKLSALSNDYGKNSASDPQLGPTFPHFIWRQQKAMDKSNPFSQITQQLLLSSFYLMPQH